MYARDPAWTLNSDKPTIARRCFIYGDTDPKKCTFVNMASHNDAKIYDIWTPSTKVWPDNTPQRCVHKTEYSDVKLIRDTCAAITDKGICNLDVSSCPPLTSKQEIGGFTCNDNGKLDIVPPA